MQLLHKISFYFNELIAKNLSSEKRQEYIDKTHQGISLETFPYFVRADKEIVLRSFIKNCPTEQLKFAHKVFQNNPIVAKKAILSNPNNIKYISKKLLNDENFLLDVAQEENSIIELRYISPRLFKDRDFILQFLKIKAHHVLPSLTLSKDLISNIDFMKDAVGQSPYAFQYINQEHIVNQELALKVFSTPNFHIYNPKLISLYNSYYQDNYDFNVLVLYQNLDIFKFFNQSLRNNPAICKIAVNTHNLDETALDKEAFNENKHIVFELVSKNPKIYSTLSKEMQLEARIAKTALILDENNFKFLPESLSKNIAFLKIIYKENQNIFNHLLENPFHKYLLKDKKIVSIVMSQVKNNSELFKTINQYHFEEKDLITSALYENPSCYEYLNIEQREEEKYILASLSQKVFKNIRHIPDSVFKNTSSVDKILKNMYKKDFFLHVDNDKDKFHLTRLAYKIFLNNCDYQHIIEKNGYSNFIENQVENNFDVVSFFNKIIYYKQNTSNQTLN